MWIGVIICNKTTHSGVKFAKYWLLTSIPLSTFLPWSRGDHHPIHSAYSTLFPGLNLHPWQAIVNHAGEAMMWEDNITTDSLHYPDITKDSQWQLQCDDKTVTRLYH